MIVWACSGRLRSAERAEPTRANEHERTGHPPPFGPTPRTAGYREETMMSTVPLPNDPSLDQLRERAKELRDRVRAGDPAALALLAEHHPKRAHGVSLTGAQLVVARHFGFPSWARLK